jgi:hypothetical protein
MEQSPSWEANRFSASQEISHIFWNPKVHFHSDKCPPPVSIQSISPHPTCWRSILILSSHLRVGLPIGLFSSGFPNKTRYTPSHSPIRATCPSRSNSQSYHPNNNGWGVHITKLLYVVFSIPLLPRPSLAQIFSSTPVLKHPQPTFLPQCGRPRGKSWHSYIHCVDVTVYCFTSVLIHCIFDTIFVHEISYLFLVSSSVGDHTLYRCVTEWQIYVVQPVLNVTWT